MSESISRSNCGSWNRSMEGRSKDGESGNDTDVKIASKAVAIKSNTRLKKLVREGDLLKMEVNKKKRGKKMSARKTCSLDIYHGVMVRVKPACFTLFRERAARKRNEEQIERNFAKWNKSQLSTPNHSHCRNTFIQSFYISIFSHN